MPKPPDSTVKAIARNKKALHRYLVVDKYEAGIALHGTEVKSLRDGNVSLSESYARVEDGELILVGAHIDEYRSAGYARHEPTRQRRLLMHRREIRRIESQVAERGFTLVPLSIYFKRGRAKVELALVRGKRQFDKRQAMREREAERSIQREMRQRERERY